MQVRPKNNRLIKISDSANAVWINLDKKQRWNTGRIGTKVDLKRGNMTLVLPASEFEQYFEVTTK